MMKQILLYLIILLLKLMSMFFENFVFFVYCLSILKIFIICFIAQKIIPCYTKAVIQNYS